MTRHSVFFSRVCSRKHWPQCNWTAFKLTYLSLGLLIVPLTSALYLSFTASADESVVFNTPPVSADVGNDNSVVKLNDLLGREGRIDGYQISDDGKWVVYQAQYETNGPMGIYSVPIGGGRIRQLTPFIFQLAGFRISADAEQIVYLAKEGSTGTYGLYSVPIAGGSIRRLNGDLEITGSGGLHYQVSPDSSLVVFLAWGTSGLMELHSVGIYGGATTKLFTYNESVIDFQISPDGNYVVFSTWGGLPQDLRSGYFLYSVPIGGGVITGFTGIVGAEGIIYKISPDSTAVVFFDFSKIYSVPIGGGTVTNLSPILGIDDFKVSNDSQRVVYQAAQDMVDVSELYSVPIGGGSVTKLNPPLPVSGYVTHFKISPDDRRVVYLARQDRVESADLYSVPLSGGATTKLNAYLASDKAVLSFQISPDDSRVIYLAATGSNGEAELYSVPIGGGRTTKLSAPLVGDGTVLTFQISPDGNRVIYRANQGMDEAALLYSVPISGGIVTKLNAPIATGSTGVDSFSINPGGDQVVYGEAYSANGGAIGVLYSVPLWTSSLNIDKSVDTAVARSGDVLSYTVSVTALGGFASVVLSDTLPSGVDLEGVSNPDVVYDANQHQLRYNGTLESNQPFTFTYTARIRASIAPGSILYSEVLATALDKSYLASASVVIPQQVEIPTLNLLVLGGDNDLGPKMIELFQKAETAAGNPTMTTLILFDGPENGDSFLYRLQPDQDKSEFCPTVQNPTCDRYIENTTMWRWGEAVATSSSLAQFLTQALAAYPARQITLSLVGHGGGWSPDLLPGQPSFHDVKPGDDDLGGILWDSTPGSSLSTRELGQALHDATSTTGRRIDLLYLDACLMAMSEVAFELRNSVDYMLASENVSWTSFRYDQHFALDGRLSPLELGKQWIKHEAEELRGSDDRSNYPFTYSLLDLRIMDELLARENVLADALSNGLSQHRSQIRNAFIQSDCFDGDQDFQLLPGDVDDYYCDMASFARQIQNQFATGDAIELAAAELEAFIMEHLRVDGDQNPGRPWLSPENEWSWRGELGGVSKYMPLGEDDWKRTYYTATYLQSAAAGTWDEFLTAYWSSAQPPEPPATCGDACEPNGPEPLREYKAYLAFIAG